MYREERERGVIVKVLDMSELEAQALEYRQRTHPDCYEARIHGGETAVATDKNGNLYMICTEGVGYPVTEEKPAEFEFHGSYHVREESTEEDLLGRNVPGEIIPSRHTFDMMPFASSTLTPDELLAYPVKEEKDLSEFVRTFGSRLEQNFWLWFRELSK